MKNKAIIIDLDGTLSDSTKRVHFVSENPKDYEKFYKYIPEDLPNEWCVEILKRFLNDYHIIYLTGRPKWTESMTIDWLQEYIRKDYEFSLIMRDDGDYRPDYDFKVEKLKELTERFDILFAIDDRPGPWKAYTELGIKCLFCGKLE